MFGKFLFFLCFSIVNFALVFGHCKSQLSSVENVLNVILKIPSWEKQQLSISIFSISNCCKHRCWTLSQAVTLAIFAYQFLYDLSQEMNIERARTYSLALNILVDILIQKNQWIKGMDTIYYIPIEMRYWFFFQFMRLG